MRSIRIGGGAGYGGDRIEPALDLIRHGALDYIIFECLAERTIALAQQQKMRDPEKGYNEFLKYRMERILPLLKEQQKAGQPIVKIVTNMGAANPVSALRMVKSMAEKEGLSQLKISAVTGDNVMGAVDTYGDHIVLETGQLLRSLEDRIISANAYIGAEGIVRALKQGADIIITGRVADPALTLGPLIYEFGWSMTDYHQLGRGTVAGHLLECGAQVCGGYFADPPYKEVPTLWNVGFPIAEIREDGKAKISKLPQAGGMVTKDTVAEQLIYEIHDPSRYYTPDVTADFSGIWLEEEDKDCIAVCGASGIKHNGQYKVSVGYRDGFIGEGEISYGGSGCCERAKLAGEIIRHRLTPYAKEIQECRIDIIGVNSLYGGGEGLADVESVVDNASDNMLARDVKDAETAKEADSFTMCGAEAVGECRLRVAIRSNQRCIARLVGDEVEALYTNGPAGGGGARKYIREIVSVASIFIPKDGVNIRVVSGDDVREEECR